METVPRSPCSPMGAFWPALNGRGCASLLPRVGQFIGGIVAGPVRFSGVKANVAYPFSRAAELRVQRPANGTSVAPSVTALSVEFVAKPQEAHRVEAVIPAAIAGALRGICGQTSGSSPCGSRDSSRHCRCAKGCRWIRRMPGDDFRSGSAPGHRRHAVGWR